MKSATIAIVSPSICHEVMGLDAMILVFQMLIFKPTSYFKYNLELLDSFMCLILCPMEVLLLRAFFIT